MRYFLNVVMMNSWLDQLLPTGNTFLHFHFVSCPTFIIRCSSLIFCVCIFRLSALECWSHSQIDSKVLFINGIELCSYFCVIKSSINTASSQYLSCEMYEYCFIDKSRSWLKHLFLSPEFRDEMFDTEYWQTKCLSADTLSYEDANTFNQIIWSYDLRPRRHEHIRGILPL